MLYGGGLIFCSGKLNPFFFAPFISTLNSPTRYINLPGSKSKILRKTVIIIIILDLRKRL